MSKELLNFDLPKRDLNSFISSDSGLIEELVEKVWITDAIGVERKLCKRDIENIVWYTKMLESHVPVLDRVRGGTRLRWVKREEFIGTNLKPEKTETEILNSIFNKAPKDLVASYYLGERFSDEEPLKEWVMANCTPSECHVFLNKNSRNK
jgi:hypothetical protein